LRRPLNGLRVSFPSPSLARLPNPIRRPAFRRLPPDFYTSSPDIFTKTSSTSMRPLFSFNKATPGPLHQTPFLPSPFLLDTRVPFPSLLSFLARLIYNLPKPLLALTLLPIGIYTSPSSDIPLPHLSSFSFEHALMLMLLHSKSLITSEEKEERERERERGEVVKASDHHDPSSSTHLVVPGR
jgi:hypothetical protein